MRVVVAEPDIDARSLAVEILTDAGHDVVTVDGPPEVESVGRASPDALVTEWRFGGEGIARSLRALRADPALAGIPIVLWTSTDPRALPPELRSELAPLAVVAKPRVLPDLLEALESLASGTAGGGR